MTPFDSTFANRLAAKIEEQDKSKTAHIREGGLTEPEYRRDVGYLRALDNVREWMTEIESDLRQGT